MHAARRDCLIPLHLQTLYFARRSVTKLFVMDSYYTSVASSPVSSNTPLPASQTRQVSHPYKTGMIMISYICIYTRLNRGRDDKRCWTKGRKYPQNLICSYYSFRHSKYELDIYERFITIFLLQLLDAFSCPDMNTEAYLVPSALILGHPPSATSF